MRITRALILLLILATPASAQTPLDLVTQLDGLTTALDGLTQQQKAILTQLRTLLTTPVPIPPVTTAAELTAALAKGGPIQLAPGQYKGNWTVALPASLTGTAALTGRVGTADVAPWTLTAADPLVAVLSVTGSDVSIRGLTLTGTAKDRTTVIIGSNTATTVATQPQRISLDQVAVLALAEGGHRGIEAHGVDIRVTRSYVGDYLEQGRDSQAFWANNGPGPYLLEDNYLAGSGENVMFGGDNIRIPNMVPSDITIRGNLLYKPQAWRAKTGSVKNSFELKNAQRVVFENNIIDGCWLDGQSGHMIQLTPRNQYNTTPWVVVQDVTIRGNRTIHHTNGYAVNMSGVDNLAPSQRTNRITIEGNLFQDSVKGFQILAGIQDLKIVRNTLPAVRWNFITFDSGGLTNLTMDRNVALSGDYGINSSTTGVGVPALAAYTTGLIWVGNVIEKTGARYIPWPSPTSVPPGTTTLLPVGGLAPLLDFDYHYPGAGW